MSAIIRLEACVGPAEAIRLKTQLTELGRLPRPHIKVDLSDVTNLHLGVVNSLMLAAQAVTHNSGCLQIVRPELSEPAQLLTIAGLRPWMI